jgi:hypothetical protein
MFTLGDLGIPMFEGLLWGAVVALGIIVVAYLVTRRRRAAARHSTGDGDINV